jgi:hypothetical protein
VLVVRGELAVVGALFGVGVGRLVGVELFVVAELRRGVVVGELPGVVG